jgi:hypothetical protein
MAEFGGLNRCRGSACSPHAYRTSGPVGRGSVASEILNQQPSAFLTIEHATVSEHAEPAKIAGPSTMVAVGSILGHGCAEPEGTSGGERRSGSIALIRLSVLQ